MCIYIDSLDMIRCRVNVLTHVHIMRAHAYICPCKGRDCVKWVRSFLFAVGLRHKVRDVGLRFRVSIRMS